MKSFKLLRNVLLLSMLLSCTSPLLHADDSGVTGPDQGQSKTLSNAVSQQNEEKNSEPSTDRSTTADSHGRSIDSDDEITDADEQSYSLLAPFAKIGSFYRDKIWKPCWGGAGVVTSCNFVKNFDDDYLGSRIEGLRKWMEENPAKGTAIVAATTAIGAVVTYKLVLVPGLGWVKSKIWPKPDADDANITVSLASAAIVTTVAAQNFSPSNSDDTLLVQNPKTPNLVTAQSEAQESAAEVKAARNYEAAARNCEAAEVYAKNKKDNRDACLAAFVYAQDDTTANDYYAAYIDARNANSKALAAKDNASQTLARAQSAKIKAFNAAKKKTRHAERVMRPNE